MTWRARHPRLGWTLRLAAVAGLLAALGFGGLLWQRAHSGQAMSIPTEPVTPGPVPTDGRGDVPAPAGTFSPSGRAGPGDRPFVTSVSADGRHLRDQHGTPLLVRGDSPWSMMTDLSPAQVALYLADRERHGYNAAIVSLLGAVINGAPSDEGTTFDGLRPFVDGDVTAFDAAYWDRATSYLRLAADHGITVFLYPVDGWTIDHSFRPRSVQQCQTYGSLVAQRFAALPNLVWMSGGDYAPKASDPAAGTDVDHCFDAVVRGIRSTGDARPFSIQLAAPSSNSTDNPYWAPRVDLDFAYSYVPTYLTVLEGYARTPPKPVLLGEANYEGENNYPDSPPTTHQTLRRQMLWALTSGAAGTFSGSDDWEFLPGWEQRLDTEGVAQLDRLQALFAGLPWWTLVPDTTARVVVDGAGPAAPPGTTADPLEDEHATVTQSRDRQHTVVYVPTARTLTLDLAEVPARAEATWVDPSTGTRTPARLAATMPTPGSNAEGDGDWLLLIQPPGGGRSGSTATAAPGDAG